MEVVAIIIAVISLVFSGVSLFFSLRAQHLQNQVNELELQIKKIQLKQIEKENVQAARVEARIVKINDKKSRMRIWNSGNIAAYNVTVNVEENSGVILLEDGKLPFEILGPDKSFDIAVVCYPTETRKCLITTGWEDKDGNKEEKHQWCGF